MKVCSLFAGVGGFDLGFQQAGLETAVHIELESSCRRVLKSRFPNALTATDVRAIPSLIKRLRIGKPISDASRRTIDTIRSCGIICGGFPCQDLSVAGRRAGLAGERSGLWFVFRRIIALVRPAWVVIENVPGLLSSDEGRDFAVILSGLEKLGYGVAWRTLDAQYFGVPQRRERVFIVASLGSLSCASVLLERESVCWNPEKGSDERQNVAPTISARTSGGGGLGTDFDLDGGLISGFTRAAHGEYKEGTGTLQAEGGDAGGGSENIVVGTLCNNGKAAGSATLQDAESGHLIVAPLTTNAYADRASEENNLIAHRLRGEGFDASEDGTGRGTPIVPIAFNGRMDPVHGDIPGAVDYDGSTQCVAFSCKDHGADAGSVSPTLRAMTHDESHMNSGGQVDAFQENETLQLKGLAIRIEHGNASKADAAKILQVLREENGEEAFAEWRFTIPSAFQSSDLLQPKMHGAGVDFKKSHKTVGIDKRKIKSEKKEAEGRLRDLWEEECSGCPSPGQKHKQQSSEQSSEGVQRLSHSDSFQESEMHDLWETSEGIGILRYALSKVQETWRSNEIRISNSPEVLGLREIVERQRVLRALLYATQESGNLKNTERKIGVRTQVRRLTPT